MARVGHIYIIVVYDRAQKCLLHRVNRPNPYAERRRFLFYFI